MSSKDGLFQPIWPRCLIPILLGLASMGLGIVAFMAAQPAPVVVRWQTASELDTAGFNVYRSDSPGGPFIKVNDELIPASPDPVNGGSYSFTDVDVDPGSTVYYQLEEVDNNGNTQRHGPITIKSEGGGQVELILAVLLLAAAGLSLWATGVVGRRRREMIANG
jgi:hypothetical protein